jgi:hypothetical protein
LQLDAAAEAPVARATIELVEGVALEGIETASATSRFG